MTLKVSLCALLLGASFAVHADTRVHTVRAIQSTFISDDFNLSPGRVAIDGNFAIVISNYGGGRLAYLYQRGADRKWTARATLLAVQTTTPAQDDDVAMANGIAALRIGPVLHIYERSGDAYVEADTAGTPGSAPGLAISGRRIPRGATRLQLRRRRVREVDWKRCLAHQRPNRGTGRPVQQSRRRARAWMVMSRWCAIHPLKFANIGATGPRCSGCRSARSRRRRARTLRSVRPRSGAMSRSWKRADILSVWDRAGRFSRQGPSRSTAPPAAPFGADYRGPLLLSQSGPSWYRADPNPYLYMRNSAGGFDHVAVLQAYGAGYVNIEWRHPGRRRRTRTSSARFS